MSRDFKLIPLTKGQFAIVDEEDFEWLNQWRWHAWKPYRNTDNYYARRPIRMDDGSIYVIAMHNLILDTREGFVGDHWNGCTLDNRRCNLRQLTFKENLRNIKDSPDRSKAPPVPIFEPPTEYTRPLSVRNTIGFQNVFRMKKGWGSHIMIRGKQHYLGIYETAEEAGKVYEAAKAQLEENPRFRPKLKLSTRNTSGMRGISWHKAGKKWRVTTTLSEAEGRKHVHIGSYKTKREAIAARRRYFEEKEAMA